MGFSLVRRRADLVAVVEAAYSADPDATSWAKGFVSAVTAVAESPATAMGIVTHADDYEGVQPLLAAGSDPSFERVTQMSARMIPSAPPDVFRAAYYPGLPLCTHSELEPIVSPETREQLRGYRRILGVPEAWGSFAYPVPGVAAVFFGGLARPHVSSRVERRLFGWIAAHLDGGLRLRLQPEAAVAAVLSPAGAFLDAEDAPSREARDRLASKVRAVESTRRAGGRREPGALERWAALVDGRYSVVPREDRDGKRYYLLVMNAPPAQESARFRAREIDVVRLAARGFTGKGMAYALGLSEAAVSTALRSAASRVGLRSSIELVDVASTMFGRRPDASPLTPAEREVLELLRRGLSNAQIARLRRRALRTVANQVSSILRKTGSPSRRALSARGSMH